MTSTEKVIQEAIKLVTETPAGVRYSILHKTILERYSDAMAKRLSAVLKVKEAHLKYGSEPARGPLRFKPRTA